MTATLPFGFDPHAAPGDRRNALFLAHTSQTAYAEKPACRAEVTAWGFPDVQPFDRDHTQGFIAANDDAVILAFRGTDEWADTFFRSRKIDLVPGPWGNVHEGFQEALNVAWTLLKEELPKHVTGKRTLWLTGHSLGAAVATVLTARLSMKAGNKVPDHFGGVFTFGSPRVGDIEFKDAFNSLLGDHSFRFVNDNDIIVKVPLPVDYHHVDTLYFFDRFEELAGPMKGIPFAPYSSAVDAASEEQIWEMARLQSKHDNPYLKISESSVRPAGALGDLFPGARAHKIERYIELLEKNKP